MIEETIGKNNQKIYKYQEPSNIDKEVFFKRIMQSFSDYAEVNGIDIAKVEFDFKLINEINIRVDKRKDYYIIFHDETYLNEVRQTALIAFWILKFKPFLIVSDDGRDLNYNINCGFAAYLILGAVSEYVNRESEGKKKFYVRPDYLDKFRYALKYWDLSKESLMLIAETLCGNCIDDTEVK